jgi:hypothetical protein
MVRNAMMGDFSDRSGDFSDRLGDFSDRSGDFSDRLGDFSDRSGDFSDLFYCSLCAGRYNVDKSNVTSEVKKVETQINISSLPTKMKTLTTSSSSQPQLISMHLMAIESWSILTQPWTGSHYLQALSDSNNCEQYW